MVQVTPPEGWRPPPQSKPGDAEAGHSGIAAAGIPADDSPPTPSVAQRPGEPIPPAKPGPPSKPRPPSETGGSTAPVEFSADADSVSPAKVHAAGVAAAIGHPSPESATPPLSPSPQAAAPGDAADVLTPGGVGTSPVELLWRKWLLLATASVAGLIVVIGLWSAFFSSAGPQPTLTPLVEQPAEPSPPEQPPAVDDVPEPSPRWDDRRWLPDRTRLMFCLPCSQLAGQPAISSWIDRLVPAWRPSVGAVLKSLGLKLHGISRLSWSATDLADWPAQSVVVIRLQPGHDAKLLSLIGEPVDLSLDGVACRRLPLADWPHPFAVLDEQTVVTGHLALLRELAQRSELHLESAVFERLLKKMPSEASLTLLVDLEAARTAGWDLPVYLFDVWPAGKQPWHTVCKIPQGLGCAWQIAEPCRSELALVCEGETAAEQVHAALGSLLPAAGRSLSARLESLPEELQAGQITAAMAQQYGLLLKEGCAAAEAARWEAVGDTVWVRADWSTGLLGLATATADSSSAMQADWRAAARNVDEANHRRLLTGLAGYAKSERHFPPAAAGGSLLPPETRLSWIATMLPYYGHPDWQQGLDFGYSWNGPQNRHVTRRPLLEVVNPALGPSTTEAGFPVTHYVGVAGIGPDAGHLSADDPRAGAFGFGRTTRMENLVDGAANTIAVLGVTGRLGPWAAGGDATARPLTQRPYVNGPDGFGSGQPDGMLAGMADGSVRFISKDIDPAVLEQLATIRGGEKATVAALIPKPALPQPAPDRPEAEPAPGESPPEAVEPPPDAVEPPTVPAQPVIDLQARLADVIPEIQFRETPLGEAVSLLSAMSTIPVTFDPDAMTRGGVTLRDPVTVEASEATIGQVLEQVVSGRRLAMVVAEGQVLLTSPPAHQETLRPIRYTVSDLTDGTPASAARLVALVEELMAPETWRSNGGRGTVEADGGVLAVDQTAVVHYELVTFCEKLRNARGKPLRSRLAPERFALSTRRDRAREILSRPVSANFRESTPLLDILGYLGMLTESDILVDRLALAAAGLSDRVEATLKVEQQPLAATLDALLGPLGLQYRAIDSRTLQVSTQKAVEARLELEFYPAADLLTADPTGAALIEQIKSEVAAATWKDAGGPGAIRLDRPSGCLIVLQSQPAQAAVEQLLAALRTQQKPQSVKLP
ncbi:MAG: DUF1559 domain-containing protein [Pirellulales bacterium]|nr:DUF1559 domain-containing protein [Pirellulales bacterium]